jgi:predicted RNA-binding Zn-ribbon protein involved in translation (DUF1610 family)
MSLINFDCPTCGHNLEVDEGGAGFIVKCPECGDPLQIPQLPKSHRIRKAVLAFSTLAAVAALFAANAFFYSQLSALRKEKAGLEAAFDRFRQDAQVLAMDQDAEVQRLSALVGASPAAPSVDLAQVALDAVEEAEALSRELEKSSRLLMDNVEGARRGMLRGHMFKLVESAKNGLPSQPTITDVEPGQGIQGRRIVFPVLPGRDGRILSKDAEITGVSEDKVSVRFAGGGATYSLTELHPGVAAFLPVDRLLVLPRRQWLGESIRLHELQTAQRDERIAQLRAAVESEWPGD